MLISPEESPHDSHDGSSVPAIEGWFTTDGEPSLIGSRCTGSGTYFFPPRAVSRVPGHVGAPTEEVRLSRRGRLWSYTNAGYQPPDPYIPVTDPFRPFCIAAVELDAEKMVVLGQVVDSVAVEDLEVGMEMEIVIERLYTEDGTDHTIWKWAPVSGTTPSEQEAHHG